MQTRCMYLCNINLPQQGLLPVCAKRNEGVALTTTVASQEDIGMKVKRRSTVREESRLMIVRLTSVRQSEDKRLRAS